LRTCQSRPRRRGGLERSRGGRNPDAGSIGTRDEDSEKPVIGGDGKTESGPSIRLELMHVKMTKLG
jgi:hypothetical protein